MANNKPDFVTTDAPIKKPTKFEVFFGFLIVILVVVVIMASLKYLIYG